MKTKLLLFCTLLVLCSIIPAAAQESTVLNVDSLAAAPKIFLRVATGTMGETCRVVYDPEEKMFVSREEFCSKYGGSAWKIAKEIDALRENPSFNDQTVYEQEADRYNRSISSILAKKRLDSYTSLEFYNNNSNSLIDELDGRIDGTADYLQAAIYLRDSIAGLDKNGSISIISVMQTPNMSKDKIFLEAHNWFNNMFNSGKSVVQLSDKELGAIIAKGHLPHIAEQVGFAWNFTISANILFRIDIKDGRFRVITTISSYESENRGGIAGAIGGGAATTPQYSTHTPQNCYPFVNGMGDGLSKKGAAKAYCACVIWSIVLQNKLYDAIEKGYIGGENEDW